MFSFCSVIDKNLMCDLNIILKNSSFQGIQDGIKIVVNPSSQVNFKVDQLSFVLDILDQDLESHAIYISRYVLKNISPCIFTLFPNLYFYQITCGFLVYIRMWNTFIGLKAIFYYLTNFFGDPFPDMSFQTMKNFPLKLLWFYNFNSKLFLHCVTLLFFDSISKNLIIQNTDIWLGLIFFKKYFY